MIGKDILLKIFVRIIDAINGWVGKVVRWFTLILVLITVYGFLEARERWLFYEASDVLQIPSYPFFLVLAFGSAILCLVLLTNLIQFVSRAVKP